MHLSNVFQTFSPVATYAYEPLWSHPPAFSLCPISSALCQDVAGPGGLQCYQCNFGQSCAESSSLVTCKEGERCTSVKALSGLFRMARLAPSSKRLFGVSPLRRCRLCLGTGLALLFLKADRSILLTLYEAASLNRVIN